MKTTGAVSTTGREPNATTTYCVRQSGSDRPIVELAARQGAWTPPDRTVIVEVVGMGEQAFADTGSDRVLTF
jgi:alpha-glucosidase